MMRFYHTESTWIPILAGIALTVSLAPAFAQPATDLDCVRCVDTVDIAPGAVTAPKLADRSVRDVNIRAGAVTKTQIAPGAVVTGKIAGNAVTANKIADVVRTLSFPARTLSYPPGGTIIRPDVRGLRWQASSDVQGFLNLMKPATYAGGDILVSILFEPAIEAQGVVDFFIRPQSYSPGEGVEAVEDIAGAPVPVGGRVGFGTVYSQQFVVPAGRLTGEWWQVAFQRDGDAADFSGDVFVRAVSFEYTSTQ